MPRCIYCGRWYSEDEGDYEWEADGWVCRYCWDAWECYEDDDE